MWHENEQIKDSENSKIKENLKNIFENAHCVTDHTDPRGLHTNKENAKLLIRKRAKGVVC